MNPYEPYWDGFGMSVGIRPKHIIGRGRPYNRHDPSIECESIAGGWGRARGLLGGAFMGTMLAQQGGRPTARDYVQNGLIAMWDGIENAGWGVHDAAATWWTDLVVGIKAVPNINWKDMFSANSLRFYGRVEDFLKLQGVITIKPQFITLQACSNVSPKDIYSSIISCMESGGIGIVGTPSAWYSNPGKPGGGYYGNTYYAGATYHNPCTRTARVGNTFDVFTNIKKVKSGFDTSRGVRYGEFNWQIGKDPEDKGYLDGDVYCIRIYDRALTDEEVAYNYAVDKARFDLP